MERWRCLRMCVKVCHDAFLWACNFVYGVCVCVCVCSCMNKHNKKSDIEERERLKGRGKERVMLKLTLQETYFTSGKKKKKPQKFFYWLRNNSLICYVRDSFQAPKMDDQKKQTKKQTKTNLENKSVWFHQKESLTEFLFFDKVLCVRRVQRENSEWNVTKQALIELNSAKGKKKGKGKFMNPFNVIKLNEF